MNLKDATYKNIIYNVIATNDVHDKLQNGVTIRH